MDIKVITCHHVYNYGATLQAFALQSYLKARNNDVGIIDYRLPVHIRYELFTPYPAGFCYELIKRFPILNYIITPIKNRNMLRTWGRKKSFDKFDKTFLNILPPTYHSSFEIKNNPPNGEVFIAGSDQIWNPQMPNGTDYSYYLDFGDVNIKRISYAASFGVNEISFEQGEFVKKQLEKFNAISVREKSGLEILKKIGIPAVRCVDPVFLLSCSEWIDLLNLDRNCHGYIMVYDFTHDDPNIRAFTKRLAEKKNLKILAINDYENTPYADLQINNAGPIEFLQYLMNAKYVVANSFHATAFSLIFHKNFATFPLKSQANPARMTDLLRSVNLLNHFQASSIDIIDEEINWDELDKSMAKDIKYSKCYLENSIN